MIKVGSDFSGVGAFNQALMRLGIDYEEVFACDMDKYARQTFIHNYGEPKYYPTNVYDREIPAESLDIYMTSPPCQAFSLAGKRLGKEDKRGILFFNSHEFIQVNKPRFFIFENVKGLLSDDGGKTFSEWINMLGGKSVNGNAVLFPYEDAVPYHIYWKVLNAKDFGVPQNRERVFIIGIRDDEDNSFQFPKEEYLIKRLKDVLEDEVLSKFTLSEEAINKCLKSQDNKDLLIKEVSDVSKCICSGYYKIPFDGQYIKVESNLEKYFLSEKMTEFLTYEKKGNIEIANINKGGQKGSVVDESSGYIGCLSATDYKLPKLVHIKSATSKGYEEATEGDSINFSVPNSETRIDRVGKGVEKTLDTGCQQGVMVGDYRTDEGFRWRKDGNSPAIMAMMRDTWKDNFTGQNPPIIKYLDTECQQGVMVVKDGRSEEEKKRRREHKQKTGKDSGSFKGQNLFLKKQEYSDAILANANPKKEGLISKNYKIRRLTPRECFRLMDFPDSFTWPVSDSQAYKQAGNSIVVSCLASIISRLKL